MGRGQQDRALQNSNIPGLEAEKKKHFRKIKENGVSWNKA